MIETESLLEGLEAERERQREAHDKMQASLDRINRLVAECDRKSERLLYVVLSSEFAADLLSSKAKQLKQARAELAAKRDGIEARLNAAFVTRTTIQEVRRFAERVSKGLDVIDYQRAVTVLPRAAPALAALHDETAPLAHVAAQLVSGLFLQERWADEGHGFPAATSTARSSKYASSTRRTIGPATLAPSPPLYTKATTAISGFS